MRDQKIVIVLITVVLDLGGLRMKNVSLVFIVNFGNQNQAIFFFPPPTCCYEAEISVLSAF